MAKELNKHTPDSENLFKRLESKYTGDLDDFEKEALEGFDSLENSDLARQLNAELNERINERFFEKKSGGSPWRYLSIAAGLVLIVGLSVFFVTFLGDKKELALDNNSTFKSEVNDVIAPSDMKPAEEPVKEEKAVNDPENFAHTSDKDGKLNRSLPIDGTVDKEEKDKDGLNTRMIIKEPRKDEALNELNTADAETGDQLKQQTDDNKAMGPPSGNITVTSTMAEGQKNGNGKEEEKETSVLNKNNNAGNYSTPAVVTSESTGKDSYKKRESPKKERTKSGENLANEQNKAEADEMTAKAKTSPNTPNEIKRDEDAYHGAEFDSKTFIKPQDYIKSEINKNEMLIEKVKSFKAELTIDEKGVVKHVKFLTRFEGCKGCESEMRRILLNMPGWKSGQKTVKETLSFIYN